MIYQIIMKKLKYNMSTKEQYVCTMNSRRRKIYEIISTIVHL